MGDVLGGSVNGRFHSGGGGGDGDDDNGDDKEEDWANFEVWRGDEGDRR